MLSDSRKGGSAEGVLGEGEFWREGEITSLRRQEKITCFQSLFPAILEMIFFFFLEIFFSIFIIDNEIKTFCKLIFHILISVIVFQYFGGKKSACQRKYFIASGMLAHRFEIRLLCYSMLHAHNVWF
ncbi:hypothetical protein IscW_ISCW018568 [Ixodes scapularis]|uniref:Uncharacterized protein n=1 Tax=Ixodes scapularis TaxID=6945 RepID=B7PQW3_IXOSC|nr:hypothetical protein IscW_ISCW018568 [Ixodes scapularis]|eukprot:XP_002436155.1 hypothetical protein IscW_ISCW018568 [Ixodes scapularis]